ncbi:acylphosphatase [Pseudooceanicola sp. CBS1P-1]|nr:acylphosphatase [Pseudooceanicola endophyticus]
MSGRVQGVGYRAWTERRARGLALSGWVRNEADGSVTALFHGPESEVAQMLDDCAEGPVFARVAAVHSHPAEAPAAPGFQVLA